jgi:hypothetical protein
MFGVATAPVLALGLGGAGVSPVGGASTTTPQPPSSAAPVHTDAAAAPGAVVHTATVGACVSGLDC